MTRKSETVEVDPSELSKEVLDELKEETSLSDDFAEQQANRVELDEMETGDPEGKSVLSILHEYGQNGYSWFVTTKSEFKSGKTAKGTIKEVEPTDEGVRLHIDHPRRREGTIWFNKTSTELANLMKYHGVESPADLDGENVVLKAVSDASPYDTMHKSWHPVYCFPHNTSLFGRIQYRLFSGIQEWREKTVFWSKDPGDFTYFGFLGSLLTSLIGVLGMALFSSGTLSSVPIIGIISQVVNYFAFGLAFALPLFFLYNINILMGFLLYLVVRGDFYEKEVNV